MMHIHKTPPLCHSTRTPIRKPSVLWARDKGEFCYMKYEQASTIDHGCFGCKHAKDERVTNYDKL